MTFLIVASDPVVLLDLVGMVRDRWPDAGIESSTTLAQAREHIARLPEITAAMIGMPPKAFSTTDLPEIIEAKNGKVIVSYFGQSETVQDIMSRGWVPLALPFTNESLTEALINAGLLSR